MGSQCSHTSVNQPALPRVVVIRNGIKDVEAWQDEDKVTRQTLEDTKRMELLDPDARKILNYWKERLPSRKVPESLSSLLQLYFESVRVVYIPSKNNATIDILHQQHKQLRNRIEAEFAAMRKKKSPDWKPQKFNKLARYFNGTLDHYSHASTWMRLSTFSPLRGRITLYRKPSTIASQISCRTAGC